MRGLHVSKHPGTLKECLPGDPLDLTVWADRGAMALAYHIHICALSTTPERNSAAIFRENISTFHHISIGQIILILATKSQVTQEIHDIPLA